MIISKEYFEATVKFLSNKYNLEKDPRQLFINPVIQEYLTRDMEFIDDHPRLDPKDDAVELDIYRKFPEYIPFRNSDLLSNKFYSEGTRARHDIFFKKILAELKKKNLVKVGGPYDIYCVALAVHQRYITNKTKDYYHFFINCNWKEGHSTTCVSILNYKTRRVLATIFLNSQDSEDTFEYTKQRFLLKLYSNILDFEPSYQIIVKELIARNFAIDLKSPELKNMPATLLMHPDEKSALIINSPYAEVLSNCNSLNII